MEGGGRLAGGQGQRNSKGGSRLLTRILVVAFHIAIRVLALRRVIRESVLVVRPAVVVLIVGMRILIVRDVIAVVICG